MSSLCPVLQQHAPYYHGGVKIKSEEKAAVAVGLEIKIARIRKGLRQWELASRVGLCQNTLSLIEAGRRRARPEVLEKIWKVIRES